MSNKKKVLLTIGLAVLIGLGVFGVIYSFTTDTFSLLGRLAVFMKNEITCLIVLVCTFSVLIITFSTISLGCLWNIKDIVKVSYNEYLTKKKEKKKQRLLSKKEQLVQEIKNLEEAP